jgi:hypothetical protein
MNGHFDDMSERIVVRVKLDGVNNQVASYTTAADTQVDEDLRFDLRSQTVAQYQALCGPSTNYSLAENRAIFRSVHSGTTESTLTVPLGIVNKTAIVGGFGVITASCGGTQEYSVGVPGNTGFLLGAIKGTDLAIPAGGVTAVWNSDYPFASATPTASGAGAGRLYYAPDKVIAPGTPINLYITAGTSINLGSGDITFELFATAFGKEHYGVTDGISTRANSLGKDIRTISPKF